VAVAVAGVAGVEAVGVPRQHTLARTDEGRRYYQRHRYRSTKRANDSCDCDPTDLPNRRDSDGCCYCCDDEEVVPNYLGCGDSSD